MNRIIQKTNEILPKPYIAYAIACYIYAAIKLIGFSDNNICCMIEIIAMFALVVISAVMYISRKKAEKTGQLSNICIIAICSIAIILYDIIRM